MPTSENPLFDFFLGPRAENISLLESLLREGLNHYRLWRQHFFHDDPSVYPELQEGSSTENFRRAFRELLVRLSKQPPYFHPRYAAQMLKDPALPAVLGYFFAQLTNPNNHAYEGGPVTTEMEMEVIDGLKKLIGFREGWGHLTSGGTLANMEALWAVRDSGKKGQVLFSHASHYSWKRLCTILRIDDWQELPVAANQRLDLNALEDALKKSPAAFIMVNFGTTGCGAVDSLPEILQLRNRYGFHMHVDAAYGGYTRAVILDTNGRIKSYAQVAHMLKPEVYAAFTLLGEADSVTIDPHKHGLMPYGAGAVLFREEKLRQVILNTAPYTYHVMDKPNIGTFSLEGSRPGAAAAACWLTMRVVPSHAEGLGKILAETLLTAREFADRVEATGKWRPLCSPDLDIVCCLPTDDIAGQQLSALNQITESVYAQFSVENFRASFILSKFLIDAETTQRLLPSLAIDAAYLTALRLVFIKHWMRLGAKPTYLDRLLEALSTH